MSFCSRLYSVVVMRMSRRNSQRCSGTSRMPMARKARAAETPTGTITPHSIGVMQDMPHPGASKSGCSHCTRITTNRADRNVSLAKPFANSTTLRTDMIFCRPFAGLMWSNCGLTVSKEKTGPNVASMPKTIVVTTTIPANGTVTNISRKKA